MEFCCPSCFHQGESEDFASSDEESERAECPQCGHSAYPELFELDDSNSIICPDCGGEFDPDECVNCPHCEAEVVQCADCGAVIDGDPHIDITGDPMCDSCHEFEIS